MINSKLADSIQNYDFELNDVVANCEFLLSTVESSISLLLSKIPIYLINFPRWFPNYLKKVVIQKKSAHKIQKTVNGLKKRTEFNRLRSLCVRNTNQCKLDYESKVETYITHQPKLFWNYYNSLKKQDKIPSKIGLDEITSNNDKTTANLFKDLLNQ